MKNLIAFMTLVVVFTTFSCKKEKDCVVYQINGINQTDVFYMAFSKEALSPDLIVQKILDGDFEKNSEKNTSLKQEIGQDSGYVWGVTFQPLDFLSKDGKYTYDVTINRVTSNAIKQGAVLSLLSTDTIPLTWFGWWGIQFSGKVELSEKMDSTTNQNAFDKIWGYTYFPGLILLFCTIGLIWFFIPKNKKTNIDTNEKDDEEEETTIVSEEELMKRASAEGIDTSNISSCVARWAESAPLQPGVKSALVRCDMIVRSDYSFVWLDGMMGIDSIGLARAIQRGEANPKNLSWEEWVKEETDLPKK